MKKFPFSCQHAGTLWGLCRGRSRKHCRAHKNLKIRFHKHLDAVVQYVNMVKRGKNYGSKLGSNQSQAANVSICFESFKLARALYANFCRCARSDRYGELRLAHVSLPGVSSRKEKSFSCLLACLHAVVLIALRKRPTAA